eukprot:g599.t1
MPKERLGDSGRLSGIPDCNILIISAHYETRGGLEITSQKNPGLLFDYSGFPQWTYALKYAPGGSPELANVIAKLLKANKIPCKLNSRRNLDHGVFVPLLLMFPKADIPVLQLSLPAVSTNGAKNAEVCIAVGRALSKLRDKGVLIIGSGQLTHGRGRPERFAAHITRSLTQQASARQRDLIEWEKMPEARQAHGREEHLLPLHVAVGAAGKKSKTIVLSKGWWGNLCMSHFAFGLQG